MHTLLLDNYDSFTYNLFHYLAEVGGREPTVVRNDDPDFRLTDLAGYDNVVISPGPGTVERAADFGVCRQVIERGGLPMLGVCLGHQGLAYVHGGAVARAPEPRHGRLSPVLHDETGLFAGLPSPFQVVRYHSLAVTEVPPELEAVAHTPDGIVMGLRHLSRPQWGVQFHPESICTEHGHQLLRNFTELSRRWHAGRVGADRDRVVLARGTPQPASTDDTTPPASAAPSGNGAPELRVLLAALPTRWTDEVVYDRLFRASRHAVWLDSSQTGDAANAVTGRFSVLADDSGPLARVAYADVWTGRVRVRSAAGTQEIDGGFLDWLDRDLRAQRVDLPPLPCDFALGWVGYLGYELKAECGGNRAHRSTEPDAALLFADRAVVLDHATETTYLLALAPIADPAPAREWLERTADRLRGLAGEVVPEPEWEPHGIAPVLRHGRAEYLALVQRCQQAIAAGETYEVCLTNQARAEVTLDTWAAYRTLRRFSPAPLAALLRFGDVSVLSTSPERFLRVFPDGTVESKPIKGTRPRGRTPAEDEILRKDLFASEKDRSENLMIVDLVRNDLGRTARVGSVEVAKLFDVETYATVHQLVSTVRSRLRPGSSAVDCVRAAFPGGSMTGAPKIRTMQIIDQLEGGPRGVYSGAIGYFSLSGTADLSIVIRSLVATPDGIRYGTGGAIVALSDPAAEFEETAVKAGPLLRLLGADFPERAPAP
jgi:para-aminobenzoate synthetase